METLIELFDERAIENVLGPETFCPKKVVFLCPPEIAQDRLKRNKLISFLRRRECETGCQMEVEFLESSLYKTDRIVTQIEKVVADNRGCVLDITGGTDAALFAAGLFCRMNHIPVFTYSRKNNRFYNISNAEFADNLPCTLKYQVEDFFLMAGGTLRKGRVDNNILDEYDNYYYSYFDIFLANRKRWGDFIVYMQKASWSAKGEAVNLKVHADYTLKGERSARISADEILLKVHEELGFIHSLNIREGESVAFSFMDEQVRAWMRDAGSVLELFMYKSCLDAGIFDDIVSSAIVDWDGTNTKDSVSNEIDVVATRGVVPLFISCKTCEIKTEALNELAILKDRFGGKGAKAAIVTTELCNAAARHRAAQLGITVIDLEELQEGSVIDRLYAIMKVAKDF